MKRSEALRHDLDSLVERWDLPEQAAPRLEQLLRALAADPHAPTNVTEPKRALEVHVADSLCALGQRGFRDLRRIVDIGAGAGFPGLVLAAAVPNTQVDLVEAAGRKAAFIERLIAALELENARAVHARVEEWGGADGRCAYDGAVSRAVGLLATLVEYAAPMLAVGGRLVVWKGRRDPDEEQQGAAAASELGMRYAGAEWVGPYAGSRNRHLHAYVKERKCPPGYPRRPGMARKRPLGSRS